MVLKGSLDGSSGARPLKPQNSEGTPGAIAVTYSASSIASTPERKPLPGASPRSASVELSSRGSSIL